MADRTTSFAKTVEGLTHPEGALDRAIRLRDAFLERQNEPQLERVQERPDDRGSQLIRDDAPALRPSPSGPMRWPADRQAARTRLANEYERENEKISAADLAHDFRQGQPPRNHERDRER
jgi:hypothetical protein